MEVGNLKFSWKIKNFSKLQTEELYSDVFSLGHYKWKLCAHPKGYDVDDHLSIFLEVADWKILPSDWSRKAEFSLTIVNQINSKRSLTEAVAQHEFNEKIFSWGLPSIISHEELYDPTKGYLVEDVCIIEAHVTMYECGKDEPTKEDMEKFFGDLNSVIFPKKVVSPEEEAKQALKMIEEALDMVPTDVNNPGRMSQLRHALDILSSLNEASILTMEQKEKLLSMKDKLIALPELAIKALADTKLLSEKELVKKTLDHKLVRCLVEFEKAKAETVQNVQDIACLEEQIAKKKRKKNISTSKQKEMFKLSKELKTELDVLVQNWPEYEARTKAGEKSQKSIATEWSEMKQFVSSLNKPCLLKRRG